MTFGSLFSGFGGLDLGLERAGLRVIWQCEKNPYARRVLAKHWPAVPCYEDVSDVDGTVERPDLICGGDPCQENSKAGGTRRATQPSLGGEFLRIVDGLRPRVVLRENPYPSRGDAPWPWWRMRAGLESLGYAVLPFRLRACCLGADHRRDRVFLLAELADPLRPRLERTYPGLVQHRDDPRYPRRAAAPRVCRGPDGIPGRVERLVGLGNAVYVDVAEWIGRRLMESMTVPAPSAGRRAAGEEKQC